ncbi:Glycosyl hydrolase, BNR repeat precursor [Fulvivirga imtechensis AK7]|uniref:Glycosyl hydrolase, BNR repeat n=1 Tax=Fulvivirga imtechensis AK7 TaxID=1237149 RepID=L8JXL2_9BACT|nr:glycosyl hydrolase BNR repeat precursor [Fulvivirga imtechensis]ELR73530.1 Glycosyl hydrolase, BNR repeat precursor [Fulvivirga imtechensis AK7]
MSNILQLFMLFILSLSISVSYGQRKKQDLPSSISYNKELYDGLKWRNIGPHRGGRSATVTGVPGRPNLFYFGATGGGVWRTTDAGNTWENISDGFFGGSIGAVAVSTWDNNVIYVGGGEKTVRGNVSYGNGMWKSVDAGKTWTHIGLRNSRHIPRIAIHPKNPDIVYAAVLGDLFKSTDERGVYKSIDGGNTWKRVLFANADAGAVDLIMDPNNPRILYASTWKIRRTPYSLESGGEGSAIWKSTDAGETWEDISKNKGLPDGIWGISGVTVSPVNSNRVWAIIENKEGGVFRSDDSGKSWRKLNDDRNLRQRAWYYTRIYADTQDEDKVYVLNVAYHRSKDGGKTFESSYAPHGDHHDLWIAPEDNQRMIIGDDGGAQVTFDGGDNWTTYHNQPTAQFYRVTTDNHFPYRIYGAQQDNSTVRILHRTTGGSITERDWEPTAGGESAHIAVDPEDNDIVYGGSYDGFLTRVNHKTGEIRAINVWPDNPMGHGAEAMKYRFQWNFPIFFSPHDPNKLYTASNHLHATTNEGQSWEVISPDLTTNDSTKLGPSGGPITKDNTSVEYYSTIFAACESPYEKGLLWTGSDDGLVHVSRDGGQNWQNVTPAGMPKWMMVNSIDPHPFIKGGAYIAGTRYKLGDYEPYLYKTEDYGKTWTKITTGIDKEHFTRVVRADAMKKGLLYAGTENGMYISFDDGASWKSFQLNLPLVPITDLAIKNDNLIAATQGRGFWLIDDLTPLHQLNQQIAGSKYHLYRPMPGYRIDGGDYSASKTRGTNHPGGVMIHFYVKDTANIDTLALEITDMEGKLIKRYSTRPDAKKKEGELSVKPGMNRFVWDMKYPGAEGFEGMILWWSSLNGPTALPGMYKASLVTNEPVSNTEFEILADPRSSSTLADLKEQFDYLNSVIAKLTETNNTIKKIREAREQIKAVTNKMDDKDYKEIREKADAILADMKAVEEALYQTKNRSGQDPLNFPIRLNNKLGHLNSLMAMGDYKPTDQAVAFKKEVTAEIDKELDKFSKILKDDIPLFNKLVKDKQIDAVIIGE